MKCKPLSSTSLSYLPSCFPLSNTRVISRTSGDKARQLAKQLLGLRQVLNGRRWMQAERKFLGGTGWNGQGGKIQVN